MESGARVRLNTFNGSAQAPMNCKPQENYWALIGHTGTVLAFNSQLGRHLVQFDRSPQELGLYCHNSEPNSLYILGSDLVLIGGTSNA
jgi:hypothetical protein